MILTSTGGIIAIAIACGFNADAILDLIDGGIFLNNPQMLAMDEIIKHIPNVRREEILLCSVRKDS